MDDKPMQELEREIEAAITKVVRKLTWDGPYSRRVCHLSAEAAVAVVKRPRLSILALAVIHFLLFADLELPWEYCWLEGYRIKILGSQGCLLGLWAVLGGRLSPWRVVAVAVGTAAWGWFNFLATPSELPDVVLKFVDWDIPTERAFWTMGILLPARFAGLELSRATLGNKGRAGHPQFSLWQALEWMTATAMFLGAVHYISEAVDYVTVVFRFNPIQWRMGIEATSTAVSFATLWLVLGRKSLLLRCTVLLLTISIGTAMLVWSGAWPRWDVSRLLIYEAAWLSASLLVVRLAGYRLIWNWRFRRLKAEPC